MTLLIHQFMARAERTPDALMFAVYPSGAQVPSRLITWGDMRRRVHHLAAYLLRVGVQHGDRVAILAGNRPIWPLADLAVQSVGAIGVGIYPSSTAAQIDTLLADSGARWLLTDNQEQATRLAAIPLQDAVVQTIIVDGAPMVTAVGAPTVVTLDEAESVGAAALTGDAVTRTALALRLAAITAADIAAIIYTSGSTGAPKGACISHGCGAASAAAIADVLELIDDDRTLSFLPYSHAAERMFGQCTRLLVGMSSALIEDPSDLFVVAAHFEPTVFGALPRIFERLYEAADVARRDGRDPRDAVTSRIGRRVRIATSGGAMLPVAVAETLDHLGVHILGAYGQTEHLCVAMNRPSAPRFDTVGPPMPGVAVRIAGDGELLVRRNALTFSGYWHRPGETAAAFTDDGQWLRTGDQAVIADDGTLQITGRVKELIALSTGRKIAPTPIEAALVATPYVAQAVCHGEGRKYLTALLSVRRAVLETWAHTHGISEGWPLLLEHAAIRALLQHSVDAVNATLARTDRVQRFAVTADEFTVADGLLTPTLKLVRRAVDLRYAATFDALYSGGPPPDGHGHPEVPP